MNKCKIVTIFFLLLTIFTVNETDALINYNGLFTNKVIYIDPGHGGVDPGAVYKDLKESGINLNFSKILGNKLEQLGATVLYTRDGDYDLSSTKVGRKKSDLSNRVKIINETQPDLYLSVHVNSDSNSSWHGAQVFYSSKNALNKKLAESISNVLEKRKISSRKIAKINNIYMYDRVNSPGVLIEVGFISNYSDRKKMTDDEYIYKFSDLVIEGLANFFGNI